MWVQVYHQNQERKKGWDYMKVPGVNSVPFSKNRDCYFTAVLDSQQHWKEGAEISRGSPAPCVYKLAPEVYIS